MIVVINNPSAGKYYGGSVAAPVFREIADNLYSTIIAAEFNSNKPNDSVVLPIPKKAIWAEDLKSIYTNLDIEKGVKFPVMGDWIKAHTDDENIVFEEVAFNKNKVPNVIGMKAKDAIYILENNGIKTNISGRGKVVRQSIRAGQKIADNTTIKLQLGTY